MSSYINLSEIGVRAAPVITLLPFTPPMNNEGLERLNGVRLRRALEEMTCIVCVIRRHIASVRQVLRYCN